MQLDFSQKAPTPVRGTSTFTIPSFSIPPVILRVLAIIVAIGILFFFLLQLIVGRLFREPIGLVFFAQDRETSVRKHVHIVWMDPQNNSVRTLSLPDDLEVSSQTFGTYPVSSLYDYYELEQRDVQALLDYLSIFFRIDLSEYTVGSAKENSKADLKKNAVEAILHPQKTSLSLLKRLTVFSYLKFSHYSYQEEQLDDFVLPSDHNGKRLDIAKYQQWAVKRFSPSDQNFGEYSLAVLNASTRAGVATQLSTIVEGFGYQVIAVNESLVKENSGSIFISSKVEKTANAVLFLERLLGTQVIVDDTKTSEKRADIVILLGEEQAKTLIP